MKKRSKPNQQKARAEFTRTASKTHWRNLAGAPMRGGIRL